MPGSGVDAQSLDVPVHRQQYVDFRVIVYRLNIPGRVQLQVDSQSISVPLNIIFNSDVADESYAMASAALNGKDVKLFSSFLGKYYDAIRLALVNNGKLRTADELLALGSDSPYQEIDITPLVRSVRNHVGLYDMNHCSISMIDASVSSFTNIELSRFSAVNRFGSTDIKLLNSFRLREFDLVRVFAYSGIDVPPQNQLDNLSNSFTGGLNNKFLLSPVFTGLVNKIGRGNSSGGIAYMNIDMLGIERIFAQSTTVANGGIADQIITSLPTIPTLENSLSALEPRFAGQAADQIVAFIFNTYLTPSFIQDSSGSLVLGVPDLQYLLDFKLFGEKTDKKTNKKEKTVNLIPMLPTIILIHIMKKQYGEPILRFDDRIENKTMEVSGTGGSPVAVVESPSKDLMLDPYLLRFRDAFSLYSGQYQSAMEIMETIKSTTYMEIYEDRSGSFHFRFPRYNSQNSMQYIDPKEVISVEHNKNDSAVFTAETVQLVIPGVGGNSGRPPRVYVDRLSILKYGLRKPQTVENPNAITDDFADILGKFAREYFSMRDSRTAVISKLGDPTINVGHMVLFKINKDAQLLDADVYNIIDTGEDVLAGYVTSIDEELSVGGQYIQKLGLSFVRPASPANLSFSYSGAGTTWDIVNNLPGLPTSSEFAPASSGISAQTLAATQKTPQDTTPFIFEFEYTHKSTTGATFRQLLTPIDLAQVAANAKNIKAAAMFRDLALGKPPQTSAGDLKSGSKSWSATVESVERKLAVKVAQNEVWDKFLNDEVSSSIISLDSGVPSVTFNELFSFRANLEESYNRILSSVLQNLYATYSGVLMDIGNGQTASLGNVRITETEVTISTSWSTLMSWANTTYKSFDYERDHGGATFLTLWNKYFFVKNRTPLTSGDLDSARDLFRRFKEMIRLAISSNSDELGIGSIGGKSGHNVELTEAFAELNELIKEHKKALNKKHVPGSAKNPGITLPSGSTSAPTATSSTNKQYLIF